jgi:glycosyltransferase involved in cell wall biosynthesis
MMLADFQNKATNPSTAAEQPPASVRVDDSLVKECLPIKIALLTNFIPPYLLPVLRTLTNSLKHLHIFVSTPMEEDRPWESEWDGVNVTLQKSYSTRSSHKFKEGFTDTFERHFPYDTLPLLFRYRPDVIISAQLGFRTIQAAIYRVLHKSCRLVIWADLSKHTEREIGRVQSAVRRLLLSLADAVLVTGKSGSEYVQNMGVPKDHIFIAPYVTEMGPFQTAPLVKDAQVARRLLYVGQLIERKGLEQFLRALFQWGEKNKDKTCEMWVVGDGPLRTRFEGYAAPSNISLRFFGNVPYNEIHTYFASAGIFVFPTLADTWGLVVNEALAAGLPVLGSRYSQAVEELVHDGVNGWTFFTDDSADLQIALEKAMTCPLHELREMSVKSRQMSDRLTPAYSAQCFLRAIETESQPEAFANE